MKKIITFLLSAALIFSVCFTAAAAEPVVTVNAAGSVTAGSNIEFTVSLSGCADATSAAVDISFDDDKFELVSGEWLKQGSISTFDETNKKGALGALKSPDINGNLFKLVLKAKTADVNAQTVSIKVLAKNGAAEILNKTGTKSVKLSCKTHSFGAYVKVNGSQHKRTCSVCGYAETANHTWNGGTVTKQPTCKDTGIKTFACTACNADKTETIAKTDNHKFGGWTAVKAASCTSAGTQERTCSVCGKKETKSIPATGHSYGSWKVTKEATCTAAGTEARTCSKCGHSETRSIKALGHDFSSPAVTKEPTCTETGVESGTCKRCGKTTTQSIPAAGHKYGEWKETKAPTCTEKGAEERICSVCSHKETRETEALGHDFENPVVVKEPTISSAGLMEGKCRRCGETTSEIIPCSAADEATGTVFETEEGVLEEGTQLTVEEIKQDTPAYESVKNVLSEITDTFTVYDISAVLNGAEAQPDGKVTVTFNIPVGYGTNVAIYSVSDEGTYEKLESLVSEDGKTVSAALTYFSKFAVCKLGTDTSAGTDNISEPAADQSAESGSKVWIIIAAAAVVMAAGVFTGIIIYKKRKNVF